MEDIDLHLTANEASDLCPVFGSAILDGAGWDRAFVTVLDEAPVERAMAVLGHERGAAAGAGWSARRLKLKAPAKNATEDAEACARRDGWIYVVGSQFGSKDGPLDPERSWMARLSERQIASALSGSKPRIELVRLELRLHRAINDALEDSGVELLRMGRATRLTYIDRTIREAARKDRSWSGRIISSDHPINVEAADFRADGRMLLGLRYPVSADGQPILVQLQAPDAVFENPEAPLTCSGITVIEGVGSPEAPMGLRALHGDGTDRFHALVGNLDSTGKGAAILEDHPEGAVATTTHIRFGLGAGDPPRVPAEVVFDFPELRRVEGVALTSSGHFHYVVDLEGRLALRTVLAAQAGS